MKNITLYAVAFFSFFFIACKNEPKDNAVRVGAKSYIDLSIGSKSGDSFVINQLDTIKKYWELRLRSEKITSELDSFKILASVPEGGTETIYILLAKSKDSMLSMASLLQLKDNEFYLEKQGPLGASVTICEGNCETGCQPLVSVYEGVNIINCSSCSECIKTQGTLSF